MHERQGGEIKYIDLWKYRNIDRQQHDRYRQMDGSRETERQRNGVTESTEERRREKDRQIYYG